MTRQFDSTTEDGLDIIVEYEVINDEPDVGIIGGADICGITDSSGNDITEQIVPSEMERIQKEADNHVRQMWDFDD
jgi:hypothetical protein